MKKQCYEYGAVITTLHFSSKLMNRNTKLEGFTLNQLDRSVRRKHSSILGPFISYKEKKFCEYSSWGLYYKTFYGSNCCCIIISQSVCHFLSLPLQSNISRQGSIMPEQSPILESALIVGSWSCPQIIGQGGSDRKSQTLQLITIRQQLLP